MSEVQSDWVVGILHKRASLFTLMAGEMFVARFLFSEFPPESEHYFAIIMVGLLGLVLIHTALQAYSKGSTVLALRVSLTLQIWIETTAFLLSSGRFGSCHFVTCTLESPLV